MPDMAATAAEDHAPPFARLIESHRRGRIFQHGVAVVLLAIGGLLLLLAALGLPEPSPVPLVLGLLGLVLAIFPWRESRLRAERIEGLEVLRDEWALSTPAERDRLRAILARLYR